MKDENKRIATEVKMPLNTIQLFWICVLSAMYQQVVVLLLDSWLETKCLEYIYSICY